MSRRVDLLARQRANEVVTRVLELLVLCVGAAVRGGLRVRNNEPDERFSPIPHPGIAVEIRLAEKVRGNRMSALGRAPQPLRRFLVIVLYALAVLVGPGEVEHRA